MKIAIITIGSELLNGSRLDTNSKWIAQKVLPWNGEIVSKISIPDTDQDIINTLNYYISQSLDMIICTGGLGPTHDDITAKTLYDYFKDTPIFDDDYWYILKGEFKKRGYDISNLNKSQAYRPSIGKIIPTNNDFEKSGLGNNSNPPINPIVMDISIFFSLRDFE